MKTKLKLMLSLQLQRSSEMRTKIKIKIKINTQMKMKIQLKVKGKDKCTAARRVFEPTCWGHGSCLLCGADADKTVYAHLVTCTSPFYRWRLGRFSCVRVDAFPAERRRVVRSGVMEQGRLPCCRNPWRVLASDVWTAMSVPPRRHNACHTLDNCTTHKHTWPGRQHTERTQVQTRPERTSQETPNTQCGHQRKNRA